MKNLIVTLSVAVSAIVVFAGETPQTVPAASKNPTAEEIARATPAQRRANPAMRAGIIEKPGSQKGRIVFIDTQDVIAHSNAQKIARHLGVLTDFKVVAVKSKPGDPKTLKEANNADVAIVIVADDNTPPSLVAQEDCWAVVNVKRMDKGLKTDEAKKRFFEPRCRKQMIRAFSLVCGGGASTYPGNIMNAGTIEDFDLYDEGVPVDRITAYLNCLKSYGVTPMVRMPYSRACYQGWAPAPTNEAQKAVWNKYQDSGESDQDQARVAAQVKFTYHYKTSDGVQHEGVYSASSKTAVYDELKKTGVKPFGVELAPGFANRLASFGKRTYAIIVLGILCIALSVTVGRVVLNMPQPEHAAMPRHYIYGDPALMEEMSADGYASVFAHPGERLLAHYAQPGVLPNFATLKSIPTESLRGCLVNELALVEGESRERTELKRVVLWMKDELGEYLADGIGTPESYVRRLNQRLREEVAILERTKRESVTEAGRQRLHEINDRLRNLGLKTIAGSEEKEESAR